MNPPRLPLQDRPNGFVNGANIQTTINGKAPKAAKVRGRVVPADQMDAFKQAISGSDLTKIALIESLKKQYVNDRTRFSFSSDVLLTVLVGSQN
jgi:chromatin assembly factor 1 subunit A